MRVSSVCLAAQVAGSGAAGPIPVARSGVSFGAPLDPAVGPCRCRQSRARFGDKWLAEVPLAQSRRPARFRHSLPTIGTRACRPKRQIRRGVRPCRTEAERVHHRKAPTTTEFASVPNERRVPSTKISRSGQRSLSATAIMLNCAAYECADTDRDVPHQRHHGKHLENRRTREMQGQAQPGKRRRRRCS